jgi:DNA polymerase
LRLNEYSMTADEKLSLARFLDLASDAIRCGYRCAEREYRFSDDPPEADSVQKPLIMSYEGGTSSGGSEFQAVLRPLSSPQSPAYTNQQFSDNDSLAHIAGEVCSCAACPLGKTRTKAVPGEGAEHPLVMVIGEGPGADEDATGRPFVGRAGQLLDKMLDSIGLSRNSSCFIANVVKCRPPNNRDPLPEETAACAPFLERQVRLLKPRIILCAGRIAARTLLKTGEAIGRLRGRLTEARIGDNAVPLIATYHPSALLRNEELKRPAWEDLKMLRSALADQPALANPAALAERNG